MSDGMALALLVLSGVLTFTGLLILVWQAHAASEQAIRAWKEAATGWEKAANDWKAVAMEAKARLTLHD